VPQRCKEDPQLGNWVHRQRTRFKYGSIHFAQKAKLDEIGFKFSTRQDRENANEKKWNLQFKKLQGYSEKHGHCELFWAVDRFPSS
jgi:hypothetical protein